MSKLFCATLLIFVTAFLIQNASAGGEGSLYAEQCKGACDYRCSETEYKEGCLTYCNMCCRKCLCVPSGTSGHKEECPCYNGGPNCP
ncbi:gibberellin-regulated protein 12-like [Vicia villosa]|uniref:gibberellin-regulated protein 12-like n=1 Tax=Vicia villosa TaxID=3911 RepID=UPI00273C8526|nr:gibberellin-regulated protein 12-like [Vicia villosa]